MITPDTRAEREAVTAADVEPLGIRMSDIARLEAMYGTTVTRAMLQNAENICRGMGRPLTPEQIANVSAYQKNYRPSRDQDRWDRTVPSPNNRAWFPPDPPSWSSRNAATLWIVAVLLGLAAIIGGCVIFATWRGYHDHAAAEAQR